MKEKNRKKNWRYKYIFEILGTFSLYNKRKKGKWKMIQSSLTLMKNSQQI